MSDDRAYEEALAELTGKSAIQRDALLLGEVRRINGRVSRHHAILLGNDDDPADGGILPDVRANTTFRQNIAVGSKVVRFLFPPALAGGLVALGKAVYDAIQLIGN